MTDVGSLFNFSPMATLSKKCISSLKISHVSHLEKNKYPLELNQEVELREADS